MKTLPLTHDLVALVDDEDFLRLSIYKWSALFNKTNGIYAVRSAAVLANEDPEFRISSGKRKLIYLHREIALVGPGIRLRFADGDALNCQRANIIIRPPTQALIRRQTAARIQSILPPSVLTASDIAAHPHRGIFRDVRLTNQAKDQGGYLVKVLGVGPNYRGQFRTLEEAISIRDVEEKKRKELSMPEIPWEKVHKRGPIEKTLQKIDRSAGGIFPLIPDDTPSEDIPTHPLRNICYDERIAKYYVQPSREDDKVKYFGTYDTLAQAQNKRDTDERMGIQMKRPSSLISGAMTAKQRLEQKVNEAIPVVAEKVTYLPPRLLTAPAVDTPPVAGWDDEYIKKLEEMAAADTLKENLGDLI